MNCVPRLRRLREFAFEHKLLLSFIVLLFLLSATAKPAHADECGKAHERACCIGESSGPCQSGFVEVGGCPPAQDSQFSGGCQCGDGSPFSASSSCEAVSACGGEGQRACCVGESSGACKSGLTEVAGCSGDNCYCSSGALSSGTCQKITHCGGAGERACCNGNGEFSNNGLACDSGTVQVPGCDDSTGSCYCASGDFKSGGTCVKPSACGGKGQRACCVGTLEYASGTSASCESGLMEVNGCAGDCTCGGTTSAGEAATGTCTVIEKIAEPTINATPVNTLPTGPECPAGPALCGYADLHVHMFANLAHGGSALAGAPYDPTNGINTALGEDYGISDTTVDHSGNPLNVVDGSSGLPECPAYMRNSPIGNLCQGQHLFHGDHLPFDTTTYGGTNDSSASNFGAPSFNGWPQWTSTIHQQVYYKWLERAWRGGLRLMVMSAVTNETLCKTTPHLQKYDGTFPTDCTNSMVEIDKQINAAKDFQSWLDTQSGGPGTGWFRIVTTPQQATSAIKSGKLAVILGIEVDNLFNCHFGSADGTAKEGTVFPFEPTTDPPSTLISCTPDFIRQQVKHYYDMGVRHIFPIHNFDNAYGGPAAWQDSINVGNEVGEGEYYKTENCSADKYGFWLNKGSENFEVGVLNLLGFGLDQPPNYPSGAGGDYATCNQFGLTSLGETLINAMMDYGMIIDVDHMSRHSLEGTLDIAATRNYAGIAATHVQFFDMYTQKYSDNFGRHERMRTKDQLAKIKSLGGLISVMLKDDVQDTEKGYCLPNAICFGGASGTGGKYTTTYNGPSNNYGLNNNCRYSTTEWAQLYMYGADTMAGPVALGSDFNGVAGHVGPRYGSGACGGDPTERSAQEKGGKRLAYPFTLQGFGTFNKQTTGQRTFDFNTDGLAHVGLLPDMIADLKNIGITDQQLVPLFTSAQAYINMWGASKPDITASKLVVSAPATAVKGKSFSFTVTATDADGNTDTNYAGTVHFSSSDGLAVLPADAPLAGGFHMFTATLKTNGDQTITATDTATSSITGTSGTITVQQPPAITSANSTTFAVGNAGSFQVTATGSPSPTFSVSGALPAGVMFSSDGLLSGTPAAGAGGTYPLTITATNGVAPDATQSFTLVVNQAPAITSANHVTFAVGMAGSFTVTATGNPAPTLSRSGALPSGVTFNAATGVLGGTPAAGTGGVYNITFTAQNGVAPAATQSFTLTVNEPPAITSANTTTFKVGIADSFTVTASGYPVPTLSESGPLPSGITFNAATGVLSGTPAANIGGSYPITFTAANGIPPKATQSFTLVIDQPPAITSANTTTFTVGVPGTFTVSATGYPKPTLSRTGTLPGGVTFNASTGVLSGTPVAGSGGTYTLTFTATNGVTPKAVQTFTLQVQDFSATVTPITEVIPSGHQGLFTIQTTSLGGLTGNINFTCSGEPLHSTCAITNPVPVGGAAHVVITLYPSKNVTHGPWTLKFTGTIGTITHTYTAVLTVK